MNSFLLFMIFMIYHIECGLADKAQILPRYMPVKTSLPKIEVTEVSVDARGARIFLQEEAIVLMTTR